MKRIDYIRQLPGMEETDELTGCLLHYGLDKNAEGCPRDEFTWCDCIKCKNEEATINGKPAPYLFNCPVKPGQTVYRICNLIITPFCVHTVRFYKNGWKAYTEEEDGRTYFITDDCDWMSIVFPTLEEAEEKLVEMRGR